MKKLALGVIVGSLLAVAVFVNSGLSKENKDLIILKKSNTVILRGPVMPDLAGDLLPKAKELDRMGKHHEPIYLFMDTPGGSIQVGLEMIENLKSLHRRVDTITSFSASMGFQLVQALGERHILASGVLMSHRAAGEFSGQFGGLYPSQLDSRYELWKNRVRELDEHTVQRTNGKQTMDSYIKQYANEMWLTGSQAVEQGYADNVVSVRCDSSLSGSSPGSISLMGISIHYEMDNCPLNSSPMNVSMKIQTNQGQMDINTFLEKGGMFGEFCNSVSDRPCSLDRAITPDLITTVKTKFMERFNNHTL